MTLNKTPKELGYRFPAEWEPHDATWLSWPHKEASWPGKIESIYSPYCQFIKEVSQGEKVCINIVDDRMKDFAIAQLQKVDAPLDNIYFFDIPTNDAWCRDHGPAFLINRYAESAKIIVDWDFNAWGGKYPPYDLDDVVPTNIGERLGLPVFHPGIIMEGGSVDFNGAGTLLTSKSCLLNKNRNPQLLQSEIEKYLHDYYCVDQILWVDDGIIGDDTDGHIDDTVRFVNQDTIVTVVEENKNDGNYLILQNNLSQLKQMRLANNKQLNIIELPMPNPVIYEDQILPASYANFYISNAAVIVPTYRCKNDDRALKIIEAAFSNKKVFGIDSTDIIWGLGSFHCLSQQEPKVL